MDHSGRKKRQPVERNPFVGSDKLIYALDGVFPFMIHYIFEGEGRLDPAYLAQAIELALDQSPVMKSVARLRPVAPYWEVVDGQSADPFLTLRNLSDEVNANGLIRCEIDRFINEHLDITKSPPVRFLLIHLPSSGWIFGVKSHHCPIDAQTLFLFTEDVRFFYEQLLTGAPIPPIERMGRRGRWPLFRRVPLSLWKEAVMAVLRKKSGSWRMTRIGHIRFTDPRRPHGIGFRSLRIKEVSYAKLRSRCKSFGVTSNELILAAVAHTVRQWNSDRQQNDAAYSIVVPVDLRRYARQGGKVPRIMASFVGGTKIIVPAKAAETLEGALEQVVRETRFIKDHHLALLPNLVFPFLYLVPPRWLRWVGEQITAKHPAKLVPTVVVSNLGKADRVIPSTSRFAYTDIHGVAAAYSPAGLFITPISYRKQLTITITYRKDVCAEDEIEAFVERLWTTLVPDCPADAHGVEGFAGSAKGGADRRLNLTSVGGEV